MHSGNPKVVVAEDDLLLHRLLERSLARRDIQLIMCKNGEEAFAAFELHRPDLVVSDWKMPKLSGGELAWRILQIEPNQRFIFITGFDDELVTKEAWYRDEFILMPKPFTPRDLAKQIEYALAPKFPGPPTAVQES